MEESTEAATVTTPKSLILLGRDVAQMPCFRGSWLYGITSGVGSGILTFMFTSRVPLASHVTLGMTCGVTLVYFSVCRYRFAKEELMAARLKVLMKESVTLEGVDQENKVKEIEELTKKKV
ncbi:MdBV-13 [Microplitis demolitor]|uniref:lethal (3) 87Df n=1 Tax=Microplitis demolitor TaxID=69319 RepID=UPI00044002C1|nr:cytochrome c oxidase protein 20 homolog [Microplitis demolitor]KAG6558476.1 MdBV-13 [Microplitis demolitor]